MIVERRPDSYGDSLTVCTAPDEDRFDYRAGMLGKALSTVID